MGRRILPKSGPFSDVSAPTTEQRSSRLLQLPPEIRNRIYGYVFAGDIKVWPGKLPTAKLNKEAAKIPPLAISSKQLHAEALPIFYSNTTFIFAYQSRFKQWARAIGHERCQMLKNVLIAIPWNMFMSDMGRLYQRLHEQELRHFAAVVDSFLQELAYLEVSVKKGVVKTGFPGLTGKMSELLTWTSAPSEAAEDLITRWKKDEVELTETWMAFFGMTSWSSFKSILECED